MTKTEYKEIKATLKRLEKSTQKIINKEIEKEVRVIELEVEEKLTGFLYDLGQELGVSFEFGTEIESDYYCEGQCSCSAKAILKFSTNKFNGKLNLT